MTAALTRAEVLVLATIKAGARTRRPRERIELLQEIRTILEDWAAAPVLRDHEASEAFAGAARLFRAEFPELLQ